MRLLAAALAVTGLAACSSATDGSGSASSPKPGSSTSVHGGGFGRTDLGSTSAPATGAASTPARTSTTSQAPRPAGRTITFDGLSGNTYRATVYASADNPDCVAHAYGAKMISFLTAHPCSGLHRVLARIVLEGRPIIVSVLSTSFPGSGETNPFANAIAFRKLEEADCGCGLSDLLRDPGVAGFPSRIPSTEAFLVLGQDSGVAVFDLWWDDGPTTDQDKTLVKLAEDLFLTDLTRA